MITLMKLPSNEEFIHWASGDLVLKEGEEEEEEEEQKEVVVCSFCFQYYAALKYIRRGRVKGRVRGRKGMRGKEGES